MSPRFTGEGQMLISLMAPFMALHLLSRCRSCTAREMEIHRDPPCGTGENFVAFAPFLFSPTDPITFPITFPVGEVSLLAISMYPRGLNACGLREPRRIVRVRLWQVFVYILIFLLYTTRAQPTVRVRRLTALLQSTCTVPTITRSARYVGARHIARRLAMGHCLHHPPTRTRLCPRQHLHHPNVEVRAWHLRPETNTVRSISQRMSADCATAANTHLLVAPQCNMHTV